MQNILNKILNKEVILEYVSTGYENLDKKIFGYQKGELITIASRPGFGKTALALKSVVINIKKGKKVFYVICGESSEKIIIKILAQMLNIKINDLLQGTYNNVSKSEIKNAIDVINEYLILEEFSSIDIKCIESMCHSMFNSELTIIDSMKYFNTFNDSNSLIRLKELAYEFKQPILLLASINIDVEKRIEKRPILLDIDNAKYISEYSDKIIVIYSDDFYKEKSERKKVTISKHKGDDYISPFINKPIIEKEIIILKNSFGSNATLKLEFNKNVGEFSEIKKIPIEDMGIDIPDII